MIGTAVTPRLKIGSRSPLVKNFLRDGENLGEVLYLPDVEKYLRDLLLVKDCLKQKNPCKNSNGEDIMEIKIFISTLLAEFLEELPEWVQGIKFSDCPVFRDKSKEPIDLTNIEDFFDYE